MVEPAARIRAFKPADKDLVQFMIGKGDMEPLAIANRQVYFHPLALATWVGLSCIFIQLMGWWPKPEYGFMAYASPLPSFAAMAVPLMFLCDWLNRPAFEEHSQDILHRLDLVDISSYYSRSPSSGFWILEYGDKFIGLIALDASLDSLSNESVTSSVADSRRLTKDRLSKKGTSSTATIRHFYVDEPYRAAGMQNDLLIHAVKHAFEADKTVQNIRAVATPLKAYISTLLRQRGFQLGELTVKVGILKWQNSIRVLSRKTWQSSSTERDA